MADSDEELQNYYVIKFENFIAIMKQTDSIYYILIDLLQNYIQEADPDDWESTPIPDLAAYFGVASELRLYLDELINNPTEKEIELSIKYDIKDILMTLEDLSAMNIMLEAMQEYEIRLYEDYKITTIVQ